MLVKWAIDRFYPSFLTTDGLSSLGKLGNHHLLNTNKSTSEQVQVNSIKRFVSSEHLSGIV